MPAYNGIRGYWNEVRVNSNYKSKNAVPQGRNWRRVADERKKQGVVFGTGISFCNTFFCSTSFCLDAVWNRRTGQKSVILITRSPQRADIPEELQNDIEEKKAADFKMTYKDSEFLYIVRGYGEQETGGYSICIRDLYLTSNAIIFDTELIGPAARGKPSVRAQVIHILW